ncbi:MAG: hypothetical protein HY541_09125 [Deltaproteobacteria bacterium]|nr:hypothetical protein [Deltaproteobacteria bacterium]
MHLILDFYPLLAAASPGGVGKALRITLVLALIPVVILAIRNRRRR